ncbi:ATP-dependent RNA helicase RhlE [Candidatus Kinetoplastibacterium blastocrithidii TCC012E]|uniref:ATP-dependent RNA helicase RhlE n=1 Tax=Candidatus Kinetoplastidibacterium blastocrithidiae TCC012E TaxID=1208922 RepID=M1LWQ8_9PROT|nr:DEAD/DEAH box helicase [Candidatus Kinetoplastibacterium blastocrithidii]AFZ83836.1 ATP-dependent RNA helicase RhlE [Candidatus Kinetoplastibacterium blastocrithidii (ex Strigomonas culicis)]AGF49962.1 ATP-dependent RNA helicase RhlE [Candidatus Kinetoplastibacterium blastocrithidii TCC012E]
MNQISFFDKDIKTSSFREFGLDFSIVSVLDEIGYVKPTLIQESAIPNILSGADFIGAAQTGTGKTAAFVLPIINRLVPFANNSISPARHLLRSLILVPTRELADQVYECVKLYSKNTNLRSLVLFGGVDLEHQKDLLHKGCEILVATPGRLIAHIIQRNVSLVNVDILVLDEADRMLDMGFIPDVDRIVRMLPKKRQSLLFSATFSEDVRKLGLTYLKDPVEADVTVPNSIADTVKQISYKVLSNEKYDAILFLIRSTEMKHVIVFTNTKIGANKLASYLSSNKISADCIHGDRTQKERIRILNDFKSSNLDVLVATDVVARGLDIAGISHVVNFDIPHNAEDYVHRIGRTGRANNEGIAVSLYYSEEEIYLLGIEKLTKSIIPRLEICYKSKAPATYNRSRTPIILDDKGSNNIIHGFDPINDKSILSAKIMSKIALLLGGTGRRL